MSNPFNQHDLTAARCTACVLPNITPPSEHCPITTVPLGRQTLTQVASFDAALFAGFVNVRSSWAQITDSDGIYVLVGDASQPFAAYPTAGAYKLVHFQSGSIVLAPLVPAIPTAGSFNLQTCGMGQSDEASYMVQANRGAPFCDGMFYYSIPRNIEIGCNQPGNGVPQYFLKDGNDIYIINSVSGGSCFLNRFPATAAGTFNTTISKDIFTDIPAGVPAALSVTATNIYLLIGTTVGNADLILQYDRATITLQNTFALGVSNSVGIYVVSDTLYYVLIDDGTSHFNFNYFHAGVLTHLGTVASLDVGMNKGFRQQGFIFHKGYLYSGFMGIAGGSTIIGKFGPLVCPETNVPIGS